MVTDSIVGSAGGLAPVEEMTELELAADDLDVVAEGLAEEQPQGVKCDNVYCPSEYCARGYDSDGK